MYFEEIKKNYLNKKFLILYIILFIILYLFCSFVKFLGQLPILIIFTLIISYYLYNYLDNKMNTMNYLFS
jgi:uncharacterized membrane protein